MSLSDVLPIGEHEAFQAALHQFGKRSIRLHADRLDQELPFEHREVPWFSAGRFLEDSNIRPSTFLNYAVADYYIQDAGSMLPLALLDVQPGELICDLCAAPGGKASSIAERLGETGFLLANENVRSRVDVLHYALAKTGMPNHAVCSYDPDDLVLRCQGMFDAVLIDAPCSGQMLVGKNKRDENAFSDNQIEHCAQRQKRILRAAVRMLKPGGRLVYSTCTFAIQENEAQMEWLMQEFADAWEPIQSEALANWQSTRTPGCYRLWPHRDHCAGGFAAGLRLIGDLEQAEPGGTDNGANRKQDGKRKKPGSNDRSPKTNQQQQKLRMQKGTELLNVVGRLSNIEVSWEQGAATALTTSAAQLHQGLGRITSSPLVVAIESGNHWIPTHGLGMLNSRCFQAAQTLDLEPDRAIEFLNGLSLTEITAPTAFQSGWALATWRDKPLGWLKGAGNRFNNHLPPWARWNSPG